MVLLVDVEVVVLDQGVLAKVPHVDVNLGLVLPHVFVHVLHKEIVGLREAGIVLSDLGLVLLELLLDVEDELLEVPLVVEDQLVDH